MQSASQQAAQAFAEHLPKMLEQVYANVPDIQTRISQATFAVMLGLIKPQVDGDRISLQIGGLEQTSNNLRLLALATGAIEEEMRRRTNVNRFNQILLAMHNYYDVYRMFPPRDEDRDDSGRSKLSCACIFCRSWRKTNSSSSFTSTNRGTARTTSRC